MDKLTRASTLEEMVDKVNEIIVQMNSLGSIEATLSRPSNLPVIIYTASNMVNIAGEVYTIPTTASYTVTTSGVGKTRLIITNGVTGAKIDDVTLNNTATSKEYFLSSGDKIMFYLNSASSTTITAQLNMVGTFYTMMLSNLTQFETIKGQLATVIAQNSQIVAQQADIIHRSEVILDNYTVQLSGIQNDYLGLNSRVTVLENK